MYGAYHSMDIGHPDRFADEYVLNDYVIREKIWGASVYAPLSFS